MPAVEVDSGFMNIPRMLLCTEQNVHLVYKAEMFAYKSNANNVAFTK